MNFLLDPSEMVEIVWSDTKLSKKTLKELKSLAEMHRVALLEQWEELREGEG